METNVGLRIMPVLRLLEEINMMVQLLMYGALGLFYQALFNRKFAFSDDNILQLLGRKVTLIVKTGLT
jgi:hypothetical protein